jgi:hypothetical protein
MRTADRRQQSRLRVHEVRDEGDVAGQPVELCDEERRFGLTDGRQRLLQLRPVRALAAFDFDAGGLYLPAVLPGERSCPSPTCDRARISSAASPLSPNRPLRVGKIPPIANDFEVGCFLV